MAETTERDNSGTTPAPRRRRKRRPQWQNVLVKIGKVLGTMLLILLTTGAIMACFAAVYIQTTIMPNTDLDLADISLDLTSTMYYTDKVTGEQVEYLTLSGEQNRVLINYDEIPKNLIDAAVATEDKRFYDHHGVDWIRTAKSVISMFTGGSVQGGSTLTQQLIKNLTQYDDVTVKRKITEIFTALEFDKNYTKPETLEWYLNYIYFGGRCYGVYTASYRYFGKHVSELSLAECASLIGITNNPSIYNPYLGGTDAEGNDDPEWGRKNNLKRAELVLWNMEDQEYITTEEYEAALTELETLTFQRGEGEEQQDVVYTWYQDQVIKDVVADLMSTYGWAHEVATTRLFSGGLSIEICIDKEAQDIVDSVFLDMENLPYISGSGQQMQAGIAVIDSVTGDVRALAGGMGEKTTSRSWSRANDSLRPPGSSIKPVAVYAPAMEMGLITPYSVMDDVPYKMEGNTAWPVNSYGYYNGRMSVYAGIEVSSNPMAVRTLGDYVTPKASFEFMRDKFGFTSLVEEKWNGDRKFSDIDLAPLALGGLTHGVSPYEMAAAYSTFPRMGKYVKPRTYTKVTYGEGRVLLENTETSRFILKESTAYYMNTMLKNVVKNGTGTAANFGGMSIAGKTGTTSSKKDRWFVGYSPYYTAAVWTGYDMQERMGTSGNPPAALWKKVMSQLHQNLENKEFPKPTDVEIISAAYCLDSGLVPTDACAADLRGSRVATGSYAKGDAPSQSCKAHELAEVCSESPFKNEAGEPTGLLHLASGFCPTAAVKSVGMLVSERNRLGGTYGARDDVYFKNHLTNLGAAGLCDVHTVVQPPAVFDPEKPETWPKDDPNFDINNSTTWPGYVPPTDHPEVSVPPEEPPPGIPIFTPTPEATLTPNPTPVQTPDPDEPFVPAG